MLPRRRPVIAVNAAPVAFQRQVNGIPAEVRGYRFKGAGRQEAVEGGKRTPGLENIVNLAKAIGITPGEFFAAFTKTYVSKLPEKRAGRTRAQ